jgi:enoyl-CoA hydratase
MPTDAAVSTDEVSFEVKGGVGLITLQRPKALNALTQGMCVAIDAALVVWAADPAVAMVVVRGSGDRAFCAGGDVRAVYEDGLARKRGESDGALLRGFFFDEYRMNRRIKTFPKPYIALIDRITMGGGVGLSVHGSHRIATERTVLAMPETGIGLFPDVGASYALPRMPGEIGLYLALTGARVMAGDVLKVGFATDLVTGDRLDDLVGELIAIAGDDARGAIDAVLRNYAIPPGDGALLQHREVIDRCFAHDRIETILTALDADGGAFATEAAAAIRTMSPTSVKATLSEMRRGRALGFDDCMIMEYRLTQTILAGHDFYEGIRAVLVDKDRNPKWNPATLNAVDDAAIAALFAAPLHGDLTFDD